MVLCLSRGDSGDLDHVAGHRPTEEAVVDWTVPEEVH